MEARERLLNLVQLLLHTTHPLTFDEINERTRAYEHEDRESAKRQFERDKEALRERGVPIDSTTDPLEVEHQYRILAEEYYLPEISFTEEEVAALFVAAHGDPQATAAFGKLVWGTDQAVIASVLEASPAAVDASAAHLHAAARAAAAGRLVRFDYRPLEGEVATRDVDAWGLAFSHGAWYLVGHDRSAGAARSFRLSRLASEIEEIGDGDPPPEGFSLRDRVRAGPWGLGEPELTATVAFSPKVAPWALPQSQGTVVDERDDGWTVAAVPASQAESFLGWIRGFGPDAELLEPEDLRGRLVSSLEALRAAL